MKIPFLKTSSKGGKMIKRIPFLSILLASAAFGQRILFGDDFATFPGSWRCGGTAGQYWTQKSSRWYSHSYSVKSTPGDNYQNNVDVWIERTVNLTDYDVGILTFWVWQRTTDGDYLEFQYSTDSGATWITAWERDGNYPSWQLITIAEIPDTANRIRFRFYSDSSGTNEGVYIDDVILLWDYADCHCSLF